jgi:hypothetical protein
MFFVLGIVAFLLRAHHVRTQQEQFAARHSLRFLHAHPTTRHHGGHH